jgi:hypothetical protein
MVGMNKFLFLTTTVALLASMANADTFQVKFNIANLDGKKGNKGSFVMEINQEWVSGNIICMLHFCRRTNTRPTLMLRPGTTGRRAHPRNGGRQFFQRHSFFSSDFRFHGSVWYPWQSKKGGRLA